MPHKFESPFPIIPPANDATTNSKSQRGSRQPQAEPERQPNPAAPTLTAPGENDPGRLLGEHDQQVLRVHLRSGVRNHLGDFSVGFRADGGFHLHGFEGH